MSGGLYWDDYSKHLFQENADREWKYARSVVWMQYLESKRMLPSPLNILPNVRNLVDVTSWIIAVCSYPRGVRARCSIQVHVGEGSEGGTEVGS